VTAFMRWLSGNGWPIACGGAIGYLADSPLELVASLLAVSAVAWTCNVTVPRRLSNRQARQARQAWDATA